MLFKALMQLLFSMFSAIFGGKANYYTTEEWSEQQDASEEYSNRRD